MSVITPKRKRGRIEDKPEKPLTKAQKAYLKAFDAWLHSGQSDPRYRSMMSALLAEIEKAPR